MAWTNVGYDGTITEIQWASMAGLLGNGYVAAGNGDCLVTAVGGARQVSVAAGSLYGDGVVSTNSGAETLALTTPVNGQWYVVALRRTWATNSAELVAIAGATTSTSTPTTVPSSFPTLNTNPGVLTDQPIAWAWCNSANTTVVVFDLRLLPNRTGDIVSVSSKEARDARYPNPTQGQTVWRNDLGYTERYFGLYNVSTNPGGLSVAGWYRDFGRGQRSILGSGSRNYSLGGWNVPTSYTDLPGMTTTVNTSGLPVMITTTITIRNAASGSPRNATFRLFDGATQLTEVGPVPVSYQTTLDNTTVTFYHQYTPTAATRTIKVQGITATGAALQFISGEIKVEELYQ